MEIKTAKPRPLPIGFRFSPTEVELLCYYLKNKAMNKTFKDPTNRFKELELYNYSPEQLREKYGVQKEREMYVFVKKVLKYKTGPRLQRRTPSNGFWRATSHQKNIEFAGCLVGHRTNLVYCTGEGRGVQTDWLMYEYKLPDQKMSDEWLLCKVYRKGREEIKINQAHLVVKPPAILCEPENSSPISASRATAEQSTATISSDRDDDQRLDSDGVGPSCLLSIPKGWLSLGI